MEQAQELLRLLGSSGRGGTAPTITTTATTGLDILSFVCINSVWYGTFAQAFA